MSEARLLLDTSILVDVLRAVPAATEWLDRQAEGALAISVVTEVELLTGCRNRAEQRDVGRELAPLSLLWVDEAISRDALDLFREFRLSHGTDFFDCLIAATARRHGLVLATLNVRHFQPLGGLEVLRPY